MHAKCSQAQFREKLITVVTWYCSIAAEQTWRAGDNGPASRIHKPPTIHCVTTYHPVHHEIHHLFFASIDKELVLEIISESVSNSFSFNNCLTTICIKSQAILLRKCHCFNSYWVTQWKFRAATFVSNSHSESNAGTLIDVARIIPLIFMWDVLDFSSWYVRFVGSEVNFFATNANVVSRKVSYCCNFFRKRHKILFTYWKNSALIASFPALTV